MTDSTNTDEEVANTLIRHHEAMVAELDELTATFVATPEDDEAKQRVVDWIHGALLPHAAEEERTSYAAAAGLAEGAALIDAMTREHTTIKSIAQELHESDGALSAGFARSLYLTFLGHQAKENEIVIPMLLAAPGVSLTNVMAEHLEAHDHGDHEGHYHHH